jgi:hypothetical protein
VFLEFGPRATTSIHLTPCSTSSIQLSKNSRVHHASRALYNVHGGVSRDPLEINSGSFPLAPHRDLPSGAVIRQERCIKYERQDNKAFLESQGCGHAQSRRT